MGWGDTVHRFGSVLCGLVLGTIPLERLFGNFRPLGLDRCSFSAQLDIQSTAANAIVAAKQRVAADVAPSRSATRVNLTVRLQDVSLSLPPC